MKNEGYTIPELIIVIILIGVFSIVAINKASYAFVDTNTINSETEEMILIKSATTYGKSIIDKLKNEDQYITGKDLTEADYLVDDENVYTNTKIKLSYNAETDSVSVEILK